MKPGNTFRRVAWNVARSAGFVLVAYVGFMLVLAFIHHKPPEIVSLPIEGGGRIGEWPTRLNLLTWNLGYGGTGEEADLFMDGGHDVLAKNKATVLQHIQNMVTVIQQHPEDLYLLQEVDIQSRRTYYVNELEFITSGLRNSDDSLALNYDVWFVPYPFTRPTGRVRSGLVTLGAYHAAKAIRVQLPGSFPWPISAFALDRCLLVWKLPREDGREWVIVNVHLAAWDADGKLRRQELAYLRDFVTEEYRQGHFVIVGGDWNAVLPGVFRDQFPSQDKPSKYLMEMPEHAFPSGWLWGVPNTQPTNRLTNAPYQIGKTYVTVIDGFLVSPNVRISSVSVIPLNFKDSDHEPVTLSVTAP